MTISELFSLMKMLGDLSVRTGKYCKYIPSENAGDYFPLKFPRCESPR